MSREASRAKTYMSPFVYVKQTKLAVSTYRYLVYNNDVNRRNIHKGLGKGRVRGSCPNWELGQKVEVGP